MIHIWKRTREACDVRMVWVRGRSNDVGNEMADKLAGEGAEDGDAINLTQWRPRDCGFLEIRRNHPIHFTAENVDCLFLFDDQSNVSADSDYWPLGGIAEDAAWRERRGHVRKAEQAEEGSDGGHEKGRGHKGTPIILELQVAIAEAATICGTPMG